MFSSNERFNDSVKVINAVDNNKFPLLVSRLAQGMQVSDKAEIFSAEELVKLESSLGLDEESLKLMLDSLNLILTQAAFSVSKPSALKDQLKNSGISDEKASSFIEVWQSSAKQIIESLKQRLTKPTQLADVKWSLGSVISSRSQAEQKIPHATLQFDLQKEEKVGEGNQEGLQPIIVQLNHEQLYNLHEQMQQIQEKLDSLK